MPKIGIAETTIAEKLQAIVTLGLPNSRLKDYYDLATLARLYAFEGERLLESVVSTFHHRGNAFRMVALRPLRHLCE